MTKFEYYKAELFCPYCGKQHIDSGEWSKRLHHTHLCLYCNRTWEFAEYIFGIEKEETVLKSI